MKNPLIAINAQDIAKVSSDLVRLVLDTLDDTSVYSTEGNVIAEIGEYNTTYGGVPTFFSGDCEDIQAIDGILFARLCGNYDDGYHFALDSVDLTNRSLPLDLPYVKGLYSDLNGKSIHFRTMLANYNQNGGLCLAAEVGTASGITHTENTVTCHVLCSDATHEWATDENVNGTLIIENDIVGYVVDKDYIEESNMLSMTVLPVHNGTLEDVYFAVLCADKRNGTFNLHPMCVKKEAYPNFSANEVYTNPLIKGVKAHKGNVTRALVLGCDHVVKVTDYCHESYSRIVVTDKGELAGVPKDMLLNDDIPVTEVRSLSIAK